MKKAKNRLHSVLIIGANPAGVAAANKLGELGVPITMVDIDADLDQKLSAEPYRLDSGVPFNFAHRPGLIRILRNGNIRCLLPATDPFNQAQPARVQSPDRSDPHLCGCQALHLVRPVRRSVPCVRARESCAPSKPSAAWPCRAGPLSTNGASPCARPTAPWASMCKAIWP